MPPDTSPQNYPAGHDGSRTLRAVGLVRTFGTGAHAVHAVDGVSVDLGAAGLTAVMGPSGSGKSTLMHLLAGLDRPTSGQVIMDGLELSSLGDDRLTALRRQRMGFVFQSFNLFDELTVAENIDVPFTIAPDAGAADPFWRARLVDDLGLGAFLHRRPTEISGGQQQRVAIARALAHKPAVLFADEPTGNLDLSTGRDVLALLASLAPVHGCTVVMVTHDATAAGYADRVLVMSDGRIAHDLPRTAAAELAQIALSTAASSALSTAASSATGRGRVVS